MSRPRTYSVATRLLVATGVFVGIATSARAQPRGLLEDPSISSRFSLFRWSEDYRDLDREERRGSLQARYKYLSIGDTPEWYVSFGGEIREKVEATSGPAFGLGPADGFVALSTRVLAHVDAHFGDHVRVFLEVAFASELGREPSARSFDVSVLSATQAFIDLAVAAHGVRVRAGRQLLAFGSLRLTSARDGVSIRRAFDGERSGVRG